MTVSGQLATETLAGLASTLREAEERRVPVAPLTDEHPGLTPAEAYAIQRLNVDHRVDAGSRVRGHKIGLTARAMQLRFGVDEPDYGTLLDDMFELEGAALLLSRYIAPQIEIEPAFVLGRPLHGPGVTVADVARATAFVLPAFEIIDSRVVDWRIRLADTIADNGSSASIVLGGCPVPLTALDLRTTRAELHVDGALVDGATGAAVLGSPLNAVAWLANALSGHGTGLAEGDVVLPGTPIRSVPIEAGRRYLARFDVLGTVEVSFVP